MVFSVELKSEEMLRQRIKERIDKSDDDIEKQVALLKEGELAGVDGEVPVAAAPSSVERSEKPGEAGQ